MRLLPLKYMNSSSFSIFGIPISLASRGEVRDIIKRWLAGNAFHRIATVGPEFLLRARRSKRFHANLLRADLCVADGIGVTIAGWLFGKHVERFPGADMLHEILKEAEKRNLSIFLAIKKDGLSSFDEIRIALLKKYQRLKVTGGEFALLSNNQQSTINSSIVFCNFGAPEQEYFLESLRGRSEHVRLVMGVGGAFDFLTGKLPRAPRLLRMLGIEWFWRLLAQPSRWRRIFRAVIVFPCLVLWDFLMNTPLPVHLKEATYADISLLLDIENKVSGTCIYSPMTQEDEWKEEMQKGSVYLIEKGGEIVGNVSYEKRGESVAYISGLVVAPRFQGQGIGREVLSKILEEDLKAMKRIDLVTHPDNMVAQKLYRSFGFVVESRKENYWGDGEPRLVMVLQR